MPITFMHPDVIVTNDQYRYLLNEFLSTKDTEIPTMSLFLDLADDVTPKQKMELTSMLQSHTDTESAIYLDRDQIKEHARNEYIAFLVFFNIVVAILFLLGFYQLILSVQANLNESKW